MRVLFATAEFAPLAKTGGLGDVSAALPGALAGLGCGVRVMLPGYPGVLDGARQQRQIAALDALPGVPAVRVLEAEAPNGTPLLVLDCPSLYRRPGDPYQDEARRDWPDNAQRFALLGRAAALACDGLGPDAWRPDVLHCNDWHAALAPVYLRMRGTPVTPSVLTVHNLAFQGNFPKESLALLRLPANSWSVDGVEFHGQVSFLKGGLNQASWITTVSPTYAREIQSEEYGCGLDALLRRRADSLCGIPNGIDIELWNPTTDPHLARNYTAATLEEKTANKTALQRRLRLAAGADIPIFGSVGRLTSQKGSDLLLEIAPRIAALPGQIVVLGAGEPRIERQFADLARSHPGRIAVHVGFDEPLAHLIEGGADFFLMPSRFEPCGMNQMYSQRYGTPPVVRATGGLADTVTDCTPETLASRSATGFAFGAAAAEAFFAAVERSAAAFRDKRLLRALRQNGMARDFSWSASARRYLEIYTRILAKS